MCSGNRDVPDGTRCLPRGAIPARTCRAFLWRPFRASQLRSATTCFGSSCVPELVPMPCRDLSRGSSAGRSDNL